MSAYRPIIFKDYCLLERISVGGMAEVYRARSFRAPDAPGFFAVKRILPNLAEDRDFITMFIDEARLAIELNHPNICQMYELGRIQDSFYIVMEFIAGRDLLHIQKHLRRQKKVMAPAQAAFVISQVCEGLDYAHRKTNSDGQPLRIVHRDISPQNVLVAYDGTVKVIDFGIARAATKTQTTQVGVLKGKFGYMSPEQVDSRELDQRSDIFAVGALFWELLTARRLFHAESDYEILEKVRAARVEPPSVRNPAVPPELDRIVLKALTRNRDDRYTYAADMARDLRAWLASVKPPYSQATLSSWMVGAFRSELESERSKLTEFAHFRTPDDVRAYNQSSDIVGTLGDEELIEIQDLTHAPEEATRVFDPESGAAAEVLAAADGEPGSTLISSGDEASRPDGTAPRRKGAGTVPLPQAGRAKARTGRALLVAAIVALTLGLGAVTAALILPNLLGSGTVMVSTRPAEDVNVLLSGQPLTGPQPMVAERLRPGSYMLEIRHPDFEAWMEEVVVERGGVVRLERELEPRRGIEVPLVLEVEPQDVTVFLNGELVEGEGAMRALTLRTVEEAVVEVAKAGYLTEVLRYDLRSREPVIESVRLREAVGTVTVRSQPPGVVFINGEERGVSSSPLQVGGLALHRPHQLEIRATSASYRDFSQTVVFDTSPEVQIFPRLRRITEAPDNPTEGAFGTLVVPDVEERWRVLVDDRDLGLVTPITEENGLALRPGERRITFQRGLEERSATAEVVAGEVLELSLPAP